MTTTVALLTVLLVAGAQGRLIRESPFFTDGRIINGVEAKQGEFPSQLSLRYLGSHNCGASVLNENWAVTAAHCVYQIDANYISLVAGTISLSEGEGTTHQAAEIIVHQGFNYEDTDYDIAVIRVKTPFVIDGVNVKAISLPAKGENPADEAVSTVIGWGRTSEGGPLAPTLLKVDISIINQDICHDTYEHEGLPVYDGQICAGDSDENKGSCNGDSGGPLFVDGTVVGLVSWALGCARPSYPTVYTRVSYYRDWISENSGV